MVGLALCSRVGKIESVVNRQSATTLGSSDLSETDEVRTLAWLVSGDPKGLYKSATPNPLSHTGLES